LVLVASNRKAFVSPMANAELSKLEEAEAVARHTVVQSEAASWETDILGYYRKVAREYNRRIEDEYRPMFEALLKQASTGPGGA
jgi:hypothetical protein